MAGAATAAAVAVVLVYLVVRFAAQNPDDANLGDREFRFQAESLAEEIADNGPFLLKDPLNRGREVYVQHLGDDPGQGWTAVLAYASRPRVECLLAWDAGRRLFRDPCTGRTFPADGRGLTSFPATVKGGEVTFDLRSPSSPGA